MQEMVIFFFGCGEIVNTRGVVVMQQFAPKPERWSFAVETQCIASLPSSVRFNIFGLDGCDAHHPPFHRF